MESLPTIWLFVSTSSSRYTNVASDNLGWQTFACFIPSESRDADFVLKYASIRLKQSYWSNSLSFGTVVLSAAVGLGCAVLAFLSGVGWLGVFGTYLLASSATALLLVVSFHLADIRERQRRQDRSTADAEERWRECLRRKSSRSRKSVAETY